MTLFNAPRALTVKSPAIPVVAGQPALVPLKLVGSEGVNVLFEYRLTLQTPDALNFMSGTGSNFDLNAFVGLEARARLHPAFPVAAAQPTRAPVCAKSRV